MKSYSPLGLRTSLLRRSLDIRTCIYTLSLDIDLPDCRPKIDAEVLIGLAWGKGTVFNVLIIRTKDVEYRAKFAGILEVTKIPELDPTTSTTLRKEVRRWMPERDSVRANDI